MLHKKTKVRNLNWPLIPDDTDRILIIGGSRSEKTNSLFNLISRQPEILVTELFIRVRKLNISLDFITQSYFAVPKNIRLSSTHYFIITIPNK